MTPSQTPILDELKERISKINSLLQNPHPGLISWKTMLTRQMDSLIIWWTEND